MRDGIAVYAIDLRQDAPFELLFVGERECGCSNTERASLEKKLR